jgi:hypothetical protein
MVDLPPLPPRIARLPKDYRGYPVPFFVQWFKDGQGSEFQIKGSYPDFRVIDSRRMDRCFSQSRCWICGDVLGIHRVFAIGPMCVINRVTMEPPSHRDCAEFAARACPFLIRPRMRRNEYKMPAHAPMPGIGIDRNPGCIALYETRGYRRFATPTGLLVRLDAPDRIDWWAEGKAATRAQVMESIESGYPLLMGVARQEGEASIKELVRQREIAMKLVPA